MIALGGFQIGGFQVNQRKSFLDVFSELSGKECLFRSSNFYIKDTDRLDRILKIKKPSVALIQLGSDEFEISFKDLLGNNEKEAGKKQAINLSSFPSKQITANQRREVPVKEMGFSFACLVNLIRPICWRLIASKKNKHLQALKKVIHEHSGTTFIILSPMPHAAQAKNKMHSLAGKWLRQMFGNLPNVRYIDLIQLFPTRQDLSHDASYQAARHRVLAKTIAHYYNNIMQKPETYLQAV